MSGELVGQDLLEQAEVLSWQLVNRIAIAVAVQTNTDFGRHSTTYLLAYKTKLRQLDEV